MNKIISTKSIGRGIVATDAIILDERPLSRLIFKPQIHNEGIRGVFGETKKE